jgi:hypothetical protein
LGLESSLLSSRAVALASGGFGFSGTYSRGEPGRGGFSWRFFRLDLPEAQEDSQVLPVCFHQFIVWIVFLVVSG